MQSVVDVLLEAIASPAWTAADSGGGGAGPQDGVKVANSGSGGGGGDRAAMVSWRGDEGHRGGGAPVWFSQFVPLILEAFPVRPLEGELLGDAEAERLRAIQALNMGLCELVVAACTGSAEVAAGAAAVATTSAGAAGKRVGEGESPSDWLTPVLAHVHDVLQSGVGGSGMAEPQVTSVLRVLRAATHNSTGKSSGIADWTAQRQANFCRWRGGVQVFLQTRVKRGDRCKPCPRRRQSVGVPNAWMDNCTLYQRRKRVDLFRTLCLDF